MHDCETFKEDLAERMLGAHELGPFVPELNGCEECQSFYRDALTLIEIVDAAQPDARTVNEASARVAAQVMDRLRPVVSAEAAPAVVVKRRPRMMVWAVGGATALFLFGLVFAAFWRKPPVSAVSSAATIQIEDDHTQGIDPGTIEYLGQSELFLRNFVKIEPRDFVELEDARSRARLQLAGLTQRREAVADFVPVHAVLDDYEIVLRDIENLDESSTEDITDVQVRIERNGLIASMKAFQPRIVVSMPQ
jgi:hypothetical protein